MQVTALGLVLALRPALRQRLEPGLTVIQACMEKIVSGVGAYMHDVTALCRNESLT